MSELTNKMWLIMVISIIMFLSYLGVVQISNYGIPIPTPVLVFIFAITFITVSAFLEHRGGVFPWILLGGGIVGVIVDVLVTCVFSGVVFVVTGKIFAVPWDVLVYLLSVGMIVSVIVLNTLPYLLGWISQLSEYKIGSKDNGKSDCEADYHFNDETLVPDEPYTDTDQGPLEDF